MRTSLAIVLLSTLLPASLLAQKSSPAEDAVAAFHGALSKGDRAAALAVLSPEITIFESGEAELSRDEYAAHHLAADMEFSAATKEEIVNRNAAESGDVAWVLTRSRTRGQFRGRSIDVEGTETMVLRRTTTGWLIQHIHWSSHKRTVS